jgi:hypothetical protein
MPGKYWQLRTNKVKRVWRYLRDNQNPSIEVGQIIQWPKEKGQTTIRKILHRKLKIEQHEPHYIPGWTQVLRKGWKFLFHYHPSCYCRYKPGDNSWMRKGPGSAYDKWNISVVIWKSVTVNQVIAYWKEQFTKASQCRNGNDHTDKN